MHASINAEHMKIGLAVTETFGGICRFLLSFPKTCICYPCLLICGVTEPIFIIFAQDVGNKLPLNTFESKRRYFKPLSNAAVPNELIYPNFAIKLVSMATSLEETGKRGPGRSHSRK